jgi:DNA-binding transcriptional LysR family regulator
MDWDKLRIFHAVAEAGSFTAAGAELGLSQSAVSRQIGALEADLDIKLFNRHARGLVLTEPGELMYRTAHEMYVRLAATRTRLTDSREKPFGELRITTTVGLGTIWLTPRLSEFLELYPDIKVEILLSDTELDLATREADVAIRMRQPVQASLIQRRLFTVHNHLYASTAYLRRHGTPKNLADLANHKFLLFGHQLPPYLQAINWLESADNTNDHDHEPVLRINNIYGLKQAVEHGIGIAVLPDYLIGNTPSMITILPDVELPDLETYFVYPEELRDSKRVAVFRDFLVSQARQWSF